MEKDELSDFLAQMMAKFTKDYFNSDFFRNSVNDGLMVMGLDFYDRDDGKTECKFFVYDADDLSEKHDLVIEFDENLKNMAPIKAGMLTAIQVAIRVDRYLKARRSMKARSFENRSRAGKKAVTARWAKAKSKKSVI